MIITFVMSQILLYIYREYILNCIYVQDFSMLLILFLCTNIKGLYLFLIIISVQILFGLSSLWFCFFSFTFLYQSLPYTFNLKILCRYICHEYCIHGFFSIQFEKLRIVTIDFTRVHSILCANFYFMFILFFYLLFFSLSFSLISYSFHTSFPHLTPTYSVFILLLGVMISTYMLFNFKLIYIFSGKNYVLQIWFYKKNNVENGIS